MNKVMKEGTGAVLQTLGGLPGLGSLDPDSRSHGLLWCTWAAPACSLALLPSELGFLAATSWQFL